MTITDIVEIHNPNETQYKPIKERQDVYVPSIVNQNISRRNGMVYLLCGSGGSGKTNLLLNMFKSKDNYRNKFHNIFYFCPESSMSSLEHHPFEDHDKVYHDLTVQSLDEIYHELSAYKIESKQKVEKKKKKKKSKYDEQDEEESEEDEEPKEIQYSAIIIDDMADVLKDKAIQKQLNRMIIKSRHLCASFIFTLQSYLYMPRMIRKQCTYTTIFKPKSIAEWNSISQELLHLNKDDALTLYNYDFDKPYTHLDLDTCENRIYKSFNLLELKT